MEKRLNTRQAAEYLQSVGVKVTPGTLEVYRHYGRGPRYYKVGCRVFYTPSDLQKFAVGQVVETKESIYQAK